MSWVRRALGWMQIAQVVACVGAPIVGSNPPVRVSGRFTITHGLFGTLPVTVAVGRCDNNDTLDVLVYGVDNSGLATSMNMHASVPPITPQMYLGNGDGTFTMTSILSLPGTMQQGGIFLDVDGDGLQDLILVSNDIELYRNLGGCTFAPPVSIASPSTDPPREIEVTDIDLDGVMDLVIVGYPMTGSPYRVLMGQGDGSFVETPIPTTPLAPPNNGNGIVGLGAFFDDVDGDGARDFFAMADDGEAWFSWGNRATGGFSRGNGISDIFSQTDPMSLSPLDYNGDGVMDYFVSGVQTQSRLLTGGSRSVSDVGFAAWVEGTDDTFAWGSWAFDADLDGTTDIFLQRTGRGSSGPIADNNFPGPTEIYLSHGDGTFYNASDSLLGSVLVGEDIACGDLSGMAHRACIAMSSDGPVLFTDDIVPRGPWVGLRLRGTVSAYDATGARVSHAGGSPATSYYYGKGAGHGSGHDPSLVIGVGAWSTTDVEIHWPSGIVQEVPALPMGAYTMVTEPQAVVLSARIAPADGHSTVTVTVNPTLLQASQASVALSGVGTLTQQPPSLGPTQWTVTAPTMPGDAVLTVTIDGHELAVRPRVHFRAS